MYNAGLTYAALAAVWCRHKAAMERRGGCICERAVCVCALDVAGNLGYFLGHNLTTNDDGVDPAHAAALLHAAREGYAARFGGGCSALGDTFHVTLLASTPSSADTVAQARAIAAAWPIADGFDGVTFIMHIWCAEVLQKRGDHASAEEKEEACDAWRAVWKATQDGYGPEHWLTAWSLTKTARCLQLCGGDQRAEEGRRLLRRAYAVAHRRALPITTAVGAQLAAAGWDGAATAEELAEYDRIRDEDARRHPFSSLEDA